MPAVLVAGHTVTQSSLHPLSASYITARQLLDSMVQGKITEASAPTIRLDATSSRLSVLYAECPFRCKPPKLFWLETGT